MSVEECFVKNWQKCKKTQLVAPSKVSEPLFILYINPRLGKNVESGYTLLSYDIAL